MVKKFNIMKTIARLMVLLAFCFSGVTQAGQVTYPDDSYSSGDNLNASDLNTKFNAIKSAVNDNDSKSTLNSLNCSTTGEAPVWNSGWECSSTPVTTGMGYSQDTTELYPTSTPINVATTTITPPADGYALVLFSGYGYLSHTNGAQSNLRYVISQSNVPSLAGDGFRYVGLDGDLPNGLYYESLQTQWVYPVTANVAASFYVHSDSNKTGTGARIINHNLSVVFLPSLM